MQQRSHAGAARDGAGADADAYAAGSAGRGQSGLCAVDCGGEAIRPGWVELVITLGEAHGRLDTNLLVRHEPEGVGLVEYALSGVRLDGEARYVFRTDAPIHGAHLTIGSSQRGLRATLRPIGRLGLLARGLARDAAETLSAVRWRVAGKKVRARNRLMRLFRGQRRMAYAGWLARQTPGWDAEVAARWREVSAHRDAHRIAVLVTAGAGRAQCDGLAERPDVRAQLLAPIAVAAIEPEAAALADALDGLECDVAVVLSPGDALAEGALLRLADAIREDAVDLLYWDTDRLSGEETRHAPRFKPEANLAYFLAWDYVGPFAVRRSFAQHVAAQAPPGASLDWIVASALAAGAGRVRRIDRVLSHTRDDWLPHAAPTSSRRPDEPATPSCASTLAARRSTIEAFARSALSDASVSIDGPVLRVRWPPPEPWPLVSLIVPTRDRLDLLEPCIEGLRHRTDYAPLEIIIADNDSREARTHAYYRALDKDPRVHVMPCPGPFNFAGINNRAATLARGSVLGFINNDIEVIEPGWLGEMVSHAVRPGTGAVGAMLTYANGLVQHAGVVMGVGGFAGHAHRFQDPADPGYMNRLLCQQNIAAVTAACLVVSRQKFHEVGGFDADAFAVAYNDVDLCLKLRAAGYENLWTPYARLKHKESASRARDYSPERRAAYERECAALTSRWGDIIASDPYYHPALTRKDESFSLD